MSQGFYPNNIKVLHRCRSAVKTVSFQNIIERSPLCDEVIPPAVRGTPASQSFWATFSYVNPLHVCSLWECGLMCRAGAGSVAWKCLTAACVERGGVSQKEHVLHSLDCHAVLFCFFPVWLQSWIYNWQHTGREIKILSPWLLLRNAPIFRPH